MYKNDSQTLGFWPKILFIFAGGCALYMLVAIAAEDAIRPYIIDYDVVADTIMERIRLNNEDS